MEEKGHVGEKDKSSWVVELDSLLCTAEGTKCVQSGWTDVRRKDYSIKSTVHDGAKARTERKEKMEILYNSWFGITKLKEYKLKTEPALSYLQILNQSKIS